MSFEFPYTADQALQNQINRSIIFNYLREKGPASRADIAKNLKISASAVSRIIENLIAENYVLEAEKVKTSVGKRPTLLQVNTRVGSVIGMDLSQERVRIGLYDFSGKMVKKRQGFKIRGQRDEAEKLVGEVRSFMMERPHEPQPDIPVESMSVGIPADVDRETGRITSTYLYKEWNAIDFKGLFETEFGIPVFIEKDVTLSVLAEKNEGKGKYHKNVIFIEVSSGVSACIIVDDHLVRGSSGSAGQIAFTVIDPKNTKPRCGTKGYLDEHASVHSIKEQFVAMLRNGRKSAVFDVKNRNVDGVEPHHVCRAALEGDELAREVIESIVGLLSIGIINLTLAVNPEIIVLGGTVANLPGVDTLFIERIAASVKNAVPIRIPEITISSLGEDVVITGAALLAIDSIISGKFPYKIGREVGR